jgi:hypothetical protein
MSDKNSKHCCLIREHLMIYKSGFNFKAPFWLQRQTDKIYLSNNILSRKILTKIIGMYEEKTIKQHTT